MDLDISDILADVSRPLQSSSLSTPGGTATAFDSSTSYADHQLLVRAWTSERCTPALLPYPTTLISRTTSRIQTQIARIEDMTAGVAPDPHTGSGPNNTNLILSILQTDLGRTQFIMRSYLRQRLAKITRHTTWYLQRHCDEDEDNEGLLSAPEKAFLRNHQALLARFYDDSFLAGFPVGLRRLDDRSGGVDMVEGPDGAEVVIVRCLKGEWGNEEHLTGTGGEEDEGAQTELRMRAGEVWVVRWRDVKAGVVNGDLQIL